MFWLMAGGLMLAAGEPPLGVVLVLIAVTLPIVAINRALDQARVRQGKAQDFTTRWSDVTSLSTRQVVACAVSLVIGAGLVAVAIALLGLGRA
ncbi:hypothetical protein DX914_19140 [Lysobacter silvisoli]|uniref:DUF2269 family protein n=2 Tax=Lysobacter silvisoli TaxID=2293254 RepID=A0A371JWG9_9GAMM|nr:hypothetical protein DX914_19140 [Lysobacter silvisoli]